MKIAIVGSGISGLACAYYLSKEHDVYVFEKNHYLGGHTNTIDIHLDNETISVDTGFIVFNLVTYPNLIQFFDELGVEYVPSNMSFSVWNEAINQYYAGTNINTFFAKRWNILNIKHYFFLNEILRFNKLAQDKCEEESYLTLGDFLRLYNFSRYFQENYILPMSSAIWSIPSQQALEFPFAMLCRFFKNHGLLGVNSHYQWFTVKNGSKEYIKKILQKSKFKYFLNEEVQEVFRYRDKNKVYVKTKHQQDVFDKVILASHAPTSLKILKDATTLERKLLSKFNYQKNIAILHYDDKAMCPNKTIWSSWNYKINQDGNTSTVYYMKKLQPWIHRDIFVSINEYYPVDEKKIIKSLEYEHPIFDLEAMENQKHLDMLNTNHLVFFVGAYFRYGFHEDGFLSALNVIKKIKEQTDVYAKETL